MSRSPNFRNFPKLLSRQVQRLWRRTKKIQHVAMFTAILALAALLVFAEVIRPNQDAKAYTARLEKSSVPLENCFQKLADTTTLDIYYAPDISLQDKQKDVKSITDQIDACRKQLTSFNYQAHNLLGLHLAGYTKVYHEAKVNQRQAYDIIGQSDDVLNQYTDLANFLNQYLDHIGAFLSYFQNLQDIEAAHPYSSPSKATIKTLADQASDLHKRAGEIRSLDTNPGSETLKSSTADMFDTIATGFDNVVKGYTNYSDYYKSIGFDQVDKAVASYDATVINMPFQLLKDSYVPKQVQQLPVKVANLLAAQSE